MLRPLVGTLGTLLIARPDPCALLISMGNCGELRGFVTDSGYLDQTKPKKKLKKKKKKNIKKIAELGALLLRLVVCQFSVLVAVFHGESYRYQAESQYLDSLFLDSLPPPSHFSFDLSIRALHSEPHMHPHTYRQLLGIA